MQWLWLLKLYREHLHWKQIVCYLVVLCCTNQIAFAIETASSNPTPNATESSPLRNINRTDTGKSYIIPNLNKIWQPYSAMCPLTFFKLGHSCYFYGYFPLNWFRAIEFCHNLGQTVALAVIEGEKENKHLKGWLKKHGNRETGVWIGGSENGHVGTWTWLPTGELVTYKDWGPSQPSGGDQHCMYMVGGFLGYQWADFHCDFEMHFLCEYNVNNRRPW